VGRWAFAHGFVQFSKLTISVVLKVAGLPEPSQQKPNDTMPFLFSRLNTRLLLTNSQWQRGEKDENNNFRINSGDAYCCL
jgi:hypothetical protein